MRRLRVVRSVGVAVFAIAVAAFAGFGSGASAGATVATGRCGAAAGATIAAVDATVAADIYHNELNGSEVRADLAHVTGAADLLRALARDDRAAVRAATARLVYHPRWHIVRLRVLDRSGRVLADVGGPYVIAPVSRTLRSGAATVGRFVMSVQDDAGVVKLETRFVGDPIAIYVGGRVAVEHGATFPASPPSGPIARLGRVVYSVVRETDNAFPSGSLTLVMLVAQPAPAVAAQPCAAARAGEFGRVAARFARLAVSLPAHYAGYAATVTQYTSALVFVRSGARQLASTGGAGPASLPQNGTINYQGRRWLVYSFAPHAMARVYLLAPAA